MKYLLLSLLVLSTTAMSAEKKTVAQATTKKSTTSAKTLDVQPESASKEMAEETALYTTKHSMKAKVSCKAHDGHEIKQGEKGYEECIKNVKSDKSDVKVEFEKQ